MRAMVVDGDHRPVDPVLERNGAATGADVLAHQLVVGVERHIADVLRLGVRGHPQRVRVVGVEHRGVTGDLDHRTLDLGQLLEGVDVLLAEVVGAHVEHRADIHVAHRHAGAQQAAARGLQHGDIHHRVAEHDARSGGAGHVADHGALAIDVDTIGGGEADALARELVDVRQHARRGGLAVGAGDGRDGNRDRGACGEEHVDRLAGHVARAPVAWRHVHSEAGRRVDLADRAADLLVALRDVRGEEVHATDVEPDRGDGAHRHLGVVGVHQIGHVARGAAGAEVGGEAQVDDFIGRRDRLRSVSKLVEQPHGLVIELDARQHLLVADAAARVGVSRSRRAARSC